MKKVWTRFSLLDFFDPLCPVWWIGSNECIVGEFLEKDIWILGIVKTTRYRFDDPDEYLREARRVVIGK